jgi:hypothetical protein
MKVAWGNCNIADLEHVYPPVRAAFIILRVSGKEIDIPGYFVEISQNQR